MTTPLLALGDAECKAARLALREHLSSGVPSARRTPRRLVAALCVLVPTLALDAAAVAPAPPQGVHIMLYQDGIAEGPDGSLFMVPAGVDVTYLPDSRVLDPEALAPALLPPAGASAHAVILRRIRGPQSAIPGLLDAADAHAQAQSSRDWLAAGTIPGQGGPLEDLGRSALLDLRALTHDGAVMAGPSRQWRYVWPRDASFAAVAFARTGHTQDALDILQFLQQVQAEDGSFEARYLPDGSGVPDDRGIQADSTGWTLWATAELLDASDPAARPQIAAALHDLVRRGTDRIRQLTADGTRVPPPSSDYWEVHTPTLTLGTAAPLLAGLEAAARMVASRAGWNPPYAQEAAELRTAADRLRALVEEEFGDDGYARSITGGERDAAVTFALPPYQPAPLQGAQEAWQATIRPMLQPAGGISPGEGWRADGVSWTPQTALYALAAATAGSDQDRYEAECWLIWIDDHRTGNGAIPEKVLADGSPAAVAPLSWTSALVILALVELYPAP